MKRRILLAAALLLPATFVLLGAAHEPKPASLRLELFVNDLQVSRDFYRDVLGFTVEREDKDYVVLHLGNVVFGLGEAKGLAGGHYFNPELQSQRRGLGTEIVVEVPALEDTFARVKEKNVEILSGIKKRPWGLSDFRIADPDGYYLRLSSQE